MPVRVILDTDIGTDVDDWIALALVLSSTELTLEGVTCVYADVAIRARMVLKLMQLRGYTGGAPVMRGVRDPLLKLDPLFWMGHEGKGLLEPEDSALEPAPEHAVDYIVRTVMANPGQIHLVCIGPLTNAALAFLREPKLAENLAHLTIMGGGAAQYSRPADADCRAQYPLRSGSRPCGVQLRRADHACAAGRNNARENHHR